MKKLSLCFALICFISFRVAADCYMFLGGNYSATLKTEGAPVYAGGVNYSYKTRYTLPDGDVAVFRDFMASPFVSLGWRLNP